MTLDEAIQSGRLDDFIAQAEADGVAAADAELARPKKKKRHYNPKQFFIVFSPEGLTPPAVVHQTHSGALWVANRMAKLNPGATFFVMGSMSFPCTASAIEARSDAAPQSDAAEGESAAPEGGDAQ